MNSRLAYSLALALALPFALAACFNPADHKPKVDGEQPLVLKSYDVPQAYASEVGGIVRRLLAAQGDKPALGSASIGPGGRVLVAAPEGIQQGVRELVDSLVANKPAPPATVTIEVWVVAGRPAAEGASAPHLAEIAPALDAVTKSQGPIEFRLVEKVSLTSVSGQNGSASGANTQLQVTATALKTSVIADLEIDPAGPSRLNTRVQIANGELVVLGQSGYTPIPGMPYFEERAHPEGLTLFYIVRAQPHAPPSRN